ncbi:MAG: hypothetical protein M1819_001592 [Sarea resinae]|nr:MAG: hypothetical protein M1819_001592 [Sarea resinae]
MPKRRRDEHDAGPRSPKRLRQAGPLDMISRLSDELLLRVLSHVPTSTLVLCQRISHRFCSIAGDSQLWKSAYYNRFVRPRASRIPGVRGQNAPPDSLSYSSRISKWLDDDDLVRRGTQTNWKRQYKLRHNWARGSCVTTEIQVTESPPIPPLLVRLHGGTVFTIDTGAGLRAWAMKGERKLIASVSLTLDSDSDDNVPTSLGVDIKTTDGEDSNVVVGFQNGSFSIFKLQKSSGAFVHQYTHSPSSNGRITAVAFAFPYLLTMTEAQLLSLYRFAVTPEIVSEDQLAPPRLLSSLKSHTVWPPLSLSLRPSQDTIVASIAYAFPTYLSGWSVGVQELRITTEGDIAESRLASAVPQGFQAIPSSSVPPSSSSGLRGSEINTGGVPTKPTSLSYTHPYLLASHPDNTLTLYLVKSTSSRLSISSGSRLWGHTSSVSGAHVGGRGRAVSVSSRGDDLRIWELEGGLSFSSTRKRQTNGEMSVQIRPEQKDDIAGSGLDLVTAALGQRSVAPGTASCAMDEMSVSKGWVSFDEENVVVLQERQQGSQALVVYDFT